MIKIKSISLRNFFSYGNVTAIVDFSNNGTTIIKGENLDNTSHGTTSNGVGKSTLINALSYALYDKCVNDVSKDDMINNINKKDMLVTVDFEKNNKIYHIERGRKIKGKGNFVQILENDKDVTPDSIGNSNLLLEKIIGLPHDLFSRIVVFSATNTSFLSLPVKSASGPSQTGMVEHLFGLTMLSDKAEVLKEHMKDVQNKIEGEQTRIEFLEKEHKRHIEQMDSAKKRITDWELKRKNEIDKLKELLAKNDDINFDEQVMMFSTIKDITEKIKSIELDIKEINNVIVVNNKHLSQLKNAEKRVEDWEFDNNNNIKKHTKELEDMSKIDIEQQREYLESMQSLTDDIDTCAPVIKELKSAIAISTKKMAEAKKELSHLSDEKCPYCLQDFKNVQEKIKECNSVITAESSVVDQSSTELLEIQTTVDELTTKKKELENKIVVKNIEQIVTIENKKISLSSKIEELKNTSNPLLDSLEELKRVEVISDEDIATLMESNNSNNDELNKLQNEHINLKSALLFKNLQDIMDVKNNISSLSDKINDKEKEINPYLDPLEELESVKIDDVDYNKINELTKKLEHQKFLQKLLTKKDSFVRKFLLDKYLPFLNIRLQKYIDDLGLPHKVEFTNDLEAKIIFFNREIGFNNLSHGQQARVNVALSFAFRDVLQKLHTPINVCLLDEVLDVGLDSVGVQSAASMLKKKAKEDNMNLFIISHRDELEMAFDNVLTVQFCDGFSQLKG